MKVKCLKRDKEKRNLKEYLKNLKKGNEDSPSLPSYSVYIKYNVGGNFTQF